MNEVSERVLLKFATLLKNNPNGNVPFLWVQAGGRVASQQSVQADVLEWCGCEGYTPTMENGKCSACGKNAHR